MRLTKWIDGYFCIDNTKQDDIIKKLAAYEDIGLSPEEIKLNMDGLDEYHKAEAEGLLVRLPCKLGDTVWFYLYEDRYYLRAGVYRGMITRLKSVQRLNQSPLVLATVEYEYPDPWYSGEMKRSEMDCSFSAFGAWVRFYLTREEAEAALKGVHGDCT